jgi:nucleotide-binding universal stress UspA family protein
MKRVVVAIDHSAVSRNLMDTAFGYAVREKDVILYFLNVVEPGRRDGVPAPARLTKPSSQRFGRKSTTGSTNPRRSSGRRSRIFGSRCVQGCPAR